MTINEIVAEINQTLESDEKRYDLWDLCSLINTKIPGLHFMREGGNYVYLTRADNRLDFVRFKAKRKKVERKNSPMWSHKCYDMAVKSVWLETAEVGEMTVEQLNNAYKQQCRDDASAREKAEHRDYQKIKSVLDATGMSIADLWNVSQILSKRYHSWNRMVEKWEG